ncbi:MAG: sugar phosphate isomerase/epimerase [Chitinophagaceae bacterium]
MQDGAVALADVANCTINFTINTCLKNNKQPLMQFGINTFLFSSPFTNASISFLPKFKEWGFDSVEIALENAGDIDPATIRKALDENGLTCHTVCAAMGPDFDMRGTKKQQADAHAYLRSLIDVMPALGAEFLVGPLYSSVGRADAVAPEYYRQQWKMVVENLRDIADYAASKNVKLAIEPLNRFETDFLNTVDQALRLIADINHESVYLHYDTFHMNIEEKNQSDAILRAGKLLGHFHACGCDRGTPGNDHIDWQGIKSALNQVGYTRGVVIESFTQDVKVIAKAAAIWRKIEPSQQNIAEDGVKFLKKLLS